MVHRALLDHRASKPELRPDTAEEKRVELHFHTRYSTLDALTDPAKAVERAAAWGHKAIAVTDHGTAQAFPEMSKAGKKYGVKILYGIEGYYVNDVEERPAVRGELRQPARLRVRRLRRGDHGPLRRDGPADRDRRGALQGRRGAGQVQHLRGPENAHPGEYHGADRHPGQRRRRCARARRRPCAPSWTSWATGP